ncbi:putative chromosome segregation protein [Erysiphe necator]|uniref:Putative chromosome segregation protein n=1 Tax=Uncinula necator TaxID=52586 RepID=A0A0B1PBN0_UNCNE|nr:putative chromosome segregation protein [Erysiphe necator]
MVTDLQAQLITAFQQSWQNLASAIRGHQFPDDLNPEPLQSSIASTTDTPEKKMVCSLLICYDVKFGEMKAQLESSNNKNSKSASELVHAQGQVIELNKAISLAQQEILHLSQSSSLKNQQLEARLLDISNLKYKLS